MLIHAARSAFLLVDVQERLAPAISGAGRCIERCRILIEAAGHLDVPVFASEQYPQGLGRTVAALSQHLPPERVFAKVCFAGTDDEPLGAALRHAGREQVVLGGMEAHVCVLQTALGLKRDGFVPIVVADAVASRDPADRDIALRRLEANDIEVASSEMVVFEWLGRAGTPTFRTVSRLVK